MPVYCYIRRSVGAEIMTQRVKSIESGQSKAGLRKQGTSRPQVQKCQRPKNRLAFPFSWIKFAKNPSRNNSKPNTFSGKSGKKCACDGAQTARCKSSSRPVTGLVVNRNGVEVIRRREQRKTNMWRVVKRTGFGLLGWRAGFLTAKSRIVIDAERDDSSDQLTLMDVRWPRPLSATASTGKTTRSLVIRSQFECKSAMAKPILP